MRIVLDTNVVLSALLWRGTPYRLLEFIRSHDQAKLFASMVLLEELAEILLRPAAGKRLALIGRTARDVLSDDAAAIDFVAPGETPAVVQADPR